MTELKKNMPKYYIFDLDGVLVDSHLLVETAIRTWATSVELDPDIVFRASRSRRDYDLVKEVAPHLDPENESFAISCLECKLCHLIAEIPGALEFYSSVPTKFRCIVTSSTRESALARLKSMGFPKPTLLIAADDVVKGKPHSEPYDLALKALGATPKECIVFEDSDTGLIAACSAGLCCVGVGNNVEGNELLTYWIRDFTTVKRLWLDTQCSA